MVTRNICVTHRTAGFLFIPTLLKSGRPVCAAHRTGQCQLLSLILASGGHTTTSSTSFTN